jgi:hypothetical protein
LLKDIEPLLRAYPLDLPAVEKRLGTLSVVDPIDERVSACILGVPEEARTQSSRKATKHG